MIAGCYTRHSNPYISNTCLAHYSPFPYTHSTATVPEVAADDCLTQHCVPILNMKGHPRSPGLAEKSNRVNPPAGIRILSAEPSDAGVVPEVNAINISPSVLLVIFITRVLCVNALPSAA